MSGELAEGCSDGTGPSGWGWEASLTAVPRAPPFLAAAPAPGEMGCLVWERVDPQGPGEQSGLPGVLSWGLRRESAINPLLLSAPAKEPEGASRNTGANTACAQGEGFHATAITGVAVAGNIFLAVETWQRKLPVHPPTCCAAAPGWGGSGALPSPSCPPRLNGGLCFPIQPFLSDLHSCSLGCSMGRFVQRNGSNNAEKRTG